LIFKKIKGEAAIYISRFQKYPSEIKNELFYVAFEDSNKLEINFPNSMGLYVYITFEVLQRANFKC